MQETKEWAILLPCGSDILNYSMDFGTLAFRDGGVNPTTCCAIHLRLSERRGEWEGGGGGYYFILFQGRVKFFPPKK